MEIEAKYNVPDEETFQRLLETANLAEFSLGAVSEAEVHDRYYDTADGSVRAWGYACRVRRKGDSYVATLKGAGEASGSVHRRVEHEVMLQGPLPPQQWPASAARTLALRLCGEQPLTRLLDIEQTRYSRLMTTGNRAVAEFSLDSVCVCTGFGAEDRYLELEIELLQTGSEDDLAKLTTELEEGWGLAPENISKFERALALLDTGASKAQGGSRDARQHLTAEERAVVARLALEREVIARRARLLMAWDDGLSRADLVRLSELSPRRVRYWLGAFRDKRLGIFPTRTLQNLTPEAVGAKGAEVAHDGAIQRKVSEQGPFSQPAGPHAIVAARSVGPGEQVQLIEEPGMEPNDPMSEAGRKILRFHFRRLLYHEPGTRLGEDIEALHDMRVATRRMRAALRVFGDHYEPRTVAPLRKGLKRAGRALGAVRDLDVFQAKIQDYQAALPESQQGGLDGLLAAFDARRGEDRRRMISYLDSEKHGRFVERCGLFVETEGLGSLAALLDGDEPRPYRVCDVAPVAVQERLGVVRAYDEWVTIPDVPLARLHALRIACKRLRYTMEFFREVFGPETRSLIKEVVAMQDHLGDLQDAVVASGILRDYLVWGTWGRDAKWTRQTGPETPVVAPGVAAYLAAKQAEIQTLLAGFPGAWHHLIRPEFRLMVAQASAVP